MTSPPRPTRFDMPCRTKPLRFGLESILGDYPSPLGPALYSPNHSDGPSLAYRDGPYLFTPARIDTPHHITPILTDTPSQAAPSPYDEPSLAYRDYPPRAPSTRVDPVRQPCSRQAHSSRRTLPPPFPSRLTSLTNRIRPDPLNPTFLAWPVHPAPYDEPNLTKPYPTKPYPTSPARPLQAPFHPTSQAGSPRPTPSHFRLDSILEDEPCPIKSDHPTPTFHPAPVPADEPSRANSLHPDNPSRAHSIHSRSDVPHLAGPHPG